MKKQKTNIFDKIICICFIIFLFQVAFHSFNASASCGNQIEILKAMEGFSKKCYPDNTQGSAGYGSAGLCKRIKKEHRKTTKSEANSYLKFVDFPKYHKQTKALGFQANKKEICTLTTLVYNKGYGTIKASGFVQVWNKWKATKTKKAKQKVVKSLLEMSCQKQRGRWVLVDGLFARQGVVANMLLNGFDNASQYEKMRVKTLSQIELKNRFAKYCNDKNLSLDKLIENLI